MSKETRELLKTIIANQEIMMKHLKMSSESKASGKSDPKKPAVKKLQSKSKSK